MYEVDERDRVVEIGDLPQSSVGAPLPMVVADEHRLLLAYVCESRDPDWDGTDVRVIGPDSVEPTAVVEFEWPYAWYMGPPNDEVFHGHPLAARGLRPYAAFEVVDSSWIRLLERRNAVHPHHDPERFLQSKRHLVLAFHDSTFECVARGYSSEVLRASPADIALLLATRLSAD